MKLSRIIYLSLVFALIVGAILLRYMDPFIVRALRLRLIIFSASILNPTTLAGRSGSSTLTKNRCRSSVSGHGHERRSAIYCWP